MSGTKRRADSEAGPKQAEGARSQKNNIRAARTSCPCNCVWRLSWFVSCVFRYFSRSSSRRILRKAAGSMCSVSLSASDGRPLLSVASILENVDGGGGSETVPLERAGDDELDAGRASGRTYDMSGFDGCDDGSRESKQQVVLCSGCQLQGLSAARAATSSSSRSDEPTTLSRTRSERSAALNSLNM